MKRIVFAAIAAAASLPAWSQVSIERPWIRATTPGAKVAGGYMTVRNASAQPDRLTGATSPGAARVETHVHIKDGDILRMREVKAYDIPARGSLELKPGGAHLMLVDLKQPLKAGDKVPVTLKFERSGELKVDFVVEPLGGPAPDHKH